ncbi:MAG: hypothetical protein V2I97_09885 [Desulfococcaceae bacterium]|jgi:hypothetical protein|nr:hypothetical protein [Desulfococcaceae bacterium]
MNTAFAITLMLSFLLAVAELFSKFRDEPFLVIKSNAAWAYILLNILIAVGSLHLLTGTDFFAAPEKEMEWLKAAFLAGLGSAVLMRSKFIKISVNGKEAAIGPEVIINVFLDTLESHIDRERALIRKKLVESSMKGIDFAKASEYVLTTIPGARQTLTPESIHPIMDEMKKIHESPMRPPNKSIALGYLVLDIMGESFLKNLFNDENREEFREGAEHPKNISA